MRKWCEQNEIDRNRFNIFFKLPFQVTNDFALRSFQYKFLHRIIPTQRFLFLRKISDTELCTFCEGDIETMEHLFYGCAISQQFWNDVIQLLRTQCGIFRELAKVDILLGNPELKTIENILILFTKRYIFRCKCRKSLPRLVEWLSKLKFEHEAEHKKATMTNDIGLSLFCLVTFFVVFL